MLNCNEETDSCLLMLEFDSLIINESNSSRKNTKKIKSLNFIFFVYNYLIFIIIVFLKSRLMNIWHRQVEAFILVCVDVFSAEVSGTSRNHLQSW